MEIDADFLNFLLDTYITNAQGPAFKIYHPANDGPSSARLRQLSLNLGFTGMITICPNGGIGNQLFQYAAGRALSLHHKTALEIDTWYFGDLEEGPRRLFLDRFQLEAKWRTYSRAGARSANSLANRIRRIIRKVSRPIVTDDDAFRRGDLSSFPNNSVLFGHFQWVEFSKDWFNIIASDLDLSRLASPIAIAQAREIEQEQWCGIQVRRGDYVGNVPFDVVDLGYYVKSIERAKSINRDLKFIVFSDDLDWCESQSAFQGMAFHRQRSIEFEDAMYLLSKCSMNIISNSSYGWWAARLNTSCQSPRVFVPKYWRRDFLTIESGLLVPDWEIVE